MEKTIENIKSIMSTHDGSNESDKLIDALLEKCLTDYAVEYHRANLSKTSARLLQEVNRLRATLKKKPLKLKNLGKNL